MNTGPPESSPIISSASIFSGRIGRKEECSVIVLFCWRVGNAAQRCRGKKPCGRFAPVAL